MKKENALQQRLKGLLPQIYIAGRAFELDLAALKLSPKDDRLPSISLADCRCQKDWSYEFEFNVSTMTLSKHGRRPVMIPAAIVRVKLPPLKEIDPVGVALEQGLPADTFLEAFPIKSYTVATLIPLLETELPEQVRRNQVELEVKALLEKGWFLN